MPQTVLYFFAETLETKASYKIEKLNSLYHNQNFFVSSVHLILARAEYIKASTF